MIFSLIPLETVDFFGVIWLSTFYCWEIIFSSKCLAVWRCSNGFYSVSYCWVIDTSWSYLRDLLTRGTVYSFLLIFLRILVSIIVLRLLSSMLLRSIALLMFIRVLSPILLLAFILSNKDLPILDEASLLLPLLWANRLALKDLLLSRLLLSWLAFILTSLWNSKTSIIRCLYYRYESFPF